MRTLLLFAACLASLAARARGPHCFEVPCTVEHGKYVVTVETPAGPRRFALDTGASRTCISGALCRALGLEAAGQGAVGDFEGHRAEVGRVTIPRLGMGRASYREVPAYLFPDSSYLFRCLGLDGVVGGDLLRRWAVRISASDSTVVLASDARLLGATDRRRSMRFARSGNRPLLRLRASNGALRTHAYVIFDSGSSGLLDCHLFELRAMEQRGILRCLRRTAGHSGNLGWTNRSEVREALRAVVPRLELAGSTLDDVPVEVTYGSVSKLGLGLLRWGDVVVDYPRRRLYLLPRTPAPAPLAGGLRNVTATLDRGRLVVGQVWDEALRGLVAPGDRIVRLGTLDVSQVDPCAFIRGEVRADRPEMTVRRSDGSLVTIPIKEL
ncbi:retropepsin-like aspartic protease [uncultured Alistipes sp.]|uniref:retropepsin-like aspartic protease n=1 Tax=uncultured Alistipes sp. TaxID=538949 RepID=UPI002630D760|nr:retropepsin-like aspartic protease [uncultured Alistipes sp.]